MLYACYRYTAETKGITDVVKWNFNNEYMVLDSYV